MNGRPKSDEADYVLEKKRLLQALFCRPLTCKLNNTLYERENPQSHQRAPFKVQNMQIVFQSPCLQSDTLLLYTVALYTDCYLFLKCKCNCFKSHLSHFICRNKIMLAQVPRLTHFHWHREDSRKEESHFKCK